ncbi:MAG TPA: peptidyl-prolyl cis-trans isomerase [Verrucomicrobiae bacterium]|jgi:peptidyl-prolyl cis-trans isomerase D|nr:peptidyl-prolyl cis-trans isomerase [Verrucomicrobiae bacterium]
MIRFLQKPGPIKKIVLGGILLVICVMMIITLVPGGLFGDYLGGGLTTQGVLAKVGDQEVTVPQVAQQARLIGKQRFQGNVPSQLMPYLMQQAAQSMITSKAITFEADRMGLAVSDDELRDYLHQGQLGQLLFPNGNFIGQQAYEQFIESQFNISVQDFEQEVKAQIAQQKLISAIGGAITVSDKEVTTQLETEDTKIKFDYAVLTLDDVKKQINPTDAELKAYYDKNKQMYVNSIPEKIDAKYILIDTKKLAETVDVTPDELQKYYSQHQDDYRLPETVTVRHILIKTPTPDANGKVDQKAVDAARAKADDVAKQLQGGANFADLAKKYSEDPGSAKDGGLLPPITRGRTVPEFEQAAFNTPVGQTTGVIRTSYGFHIIRVEAKQQARLKPLEEVKVEIEPILKQQKAAAQSQSVANTIQTLARTEGMDKAAKDKNLTVATTGMITQTDQLPGIGSAPDFMNALFGAKKNDPPATASTPMGYAVYQVTEIQPPQTPTFDQIKAKVEEQFKDERAQGMLAQKTQELSDRAHSEHDLAKAAKEVGASVKTSDLVDKTSQVPDIGAMNGAVSVAFGLKSGDISGPIQAGANGVVLKVTEVHQPTPEQMKQDWEKAKEALVEHKREEYENLYVENLRNTLEKEGKIKINKKEMERLATLSEGS